jgi:hypothetical protein
MTIMFRFLTGKRLKRLPVLCVLIARYMVVALSRDRCNPVSRGGLTSIRRKLAEWNCVNAACYAASIYAE